MDVRVWSDRHWSFWRCGAGSVGVLRLEWRRICGSCRFAPRSWSASVYSSKTYDYLGALWEIQRVNVATSLVKEWMIILTVFLHVLHCKISSVMPLESPTPELHFCWEGLSWPLSRALFTCGGIKLWTILRQDPPWFEFLVIFDFFAPWYRRGWEVSSVKIL